MNHGLLDREIENHQQATQIAAQQQTLRENSADLNDFRERLNLSEAELKDSQEKLAASAASLKQLADERDLLRKTLDQWIAAVQTRDQALKAAADQLRALADQRNDAVNKFNDLAGKYNSVVKDLNDSAAKR